MLWFLLVMFLLHYSMAFKPTWRKNAFSCREFKMKNENRTFIIGIQGLQMRCRGRICTAKYKRARKKFLTPKTSSVYWLMSTLCMAAPLIMVIYIFPVPSVWDSVRAAYQPVRVALVKHEIECLWNLMAHGEFAGSVSSWLYGMAGQVKGSKAGAGVSMLPFRSAPSAGVGTELCLVLPWAWQYSRTGEHALQCGVLRCQYWVRTLALSYLAEYLYWGSLSKPEDEMTSLFLSFLGFRSASFRECHV